MGTTVPLRPKHELAFIVSSSLDKPDFNARQLIRRHVMRGKNRRKRPADALKMRSWINQESSFYHQSNPEDGPGLCFPLAMQIGSSLPLSVFAYDMPPYALDLIFKFFTVLGQAMYPIELCLTFDTRKLFLIEYLAVDALYCHSVLWMTRAYFDWLQGHKNSNIEIHHAHQTLIMLQQRLDNSRLATSDATICVVLSLVNMTALVGNYEASRKHMMGLCKMVEMRGGVRAFTENSQIQLKICRADLTIATLTDTKPVFFSHGISWEPYIAKGQNNLQDLLPNHFAGLDKKLSNIWADLREFTKSANLAFQTGKKMDCVLFQEILISIQYRLLYISNNSSHLDTIIHVGMLAFATNVFLQMQGFAMRFEKLSARLQHVTIGLQSFQDGSVLEFTLWLLHFARITNVSVKNRDPWLEFEMSKALEALNLTSWESTRDTLKKYLWIDVLHDKGGKKAFEDAITHSPESPKSQEFNF